MIKVCMHLSELVPCIHISLGDVMYMGQWGAGTKTASLTGNSPRIQNT